MLLGADWRRRAERGSDRHAGSPWGKARLTLGTPHGSGGRNQELALAAVEPLDAVEDCMLIALATDGEDGPTDAAGAVVTGTTAERARALADDPKRFS